MDLHCSVEPLDLLSVGEQSNNKLRQIRRQRIRVTHRRVLQWATKSRQVCKLARVRKTKQETTLWMNSTT